MSQRGRLQLSGRNNLRQTRAVYYTQYVGRVPFSEDIGEVIPVVHVDCLGWEARDLAGKSHGDRWLTDWYAADALARGLRLPT